MAGTLTKSRILIKNIPWTVGNYQLEEYFSQYGRVKSAHVIFDRKTGFNKNYGFVEFFDHSIVDKILEVPHPHKLDDYIIRIMRLMPQEA